MKNSTNQFAKAKNNTMHSQKVFQFSSFHNKETEEQMKKIIQQLGASYDESKYYSPSATHLIIGDQIECTEKVLCYISAGKHILRKIYLQDCNRQQQFLKEKNYHVIKRDGTLKLSKVSLKWFNKIAESTANAPFTKWNVGCLIEDQEQLNSLIRIIQAGFGKAFNIRNISDLSNKCTLIIYDDKSKQLAIEYSLTSCIPCYPFSCIADYLIQCEISDQPILPLSYYEYIVRKAPVFSPPKTNRVKRQIMELDDSVICLDDSIHENETSTYLDETILGDDFRIIGTYKMFLLSSNQRYTEAGDIDNCLEPQFFTLWKNTAYNEALNLIILLEYDELPSVNTLKLLFEFILDKYAKEKTNFACDFHNDRNFTSIYNSIYSYILNLILTHPPINDTVISYYKQCFDKLLISYRLDTNTANAKGLVDTIYLITIHDYFTINSPHYRDTVHKLYCTMLKFDIESNLQRLIKLAASDRSCSQQTYHKLMQIIYFCNKYCKKNRFCKQLDQLKIKISSDLSFHELFSNLAKL